MGNIFYTGPVQYFRMKILYIAPVKPLSEGSTEKGMQEYSQRQAGVTWAIVLCVLVPIVLIVVFIAFRQFRKQKEPSVRGDPVMTKHTKIGSFQESTESDKLNETL